MEISSLGKQTCSPYTILTPLRPLHPEPCSTKLSTSQLLTRVMAALRCYTALGLRWGSVILTHAPS